MGQLLKRLTKLPSGLVCFYCGVDSTELKIFLFGLIGMLVLGTVFVGVGAWLKGQFKNQESIKYDVLDLEKDLL